MRGLVKVATICAIPVCLWRKVCSQFAHELTLQLLHSVAFTEAIGLLLLLSCCCKLQSRITCCQLFAPIVMFHYDVLASNASLTLSHELAC